MNVLSKKRIHTRTKAQTKVVQKSKQITRCLRCNNVQYKGVWYAPDSRLALCIDHHKDTVVHRMCPACTMHAAGTFGGILYVKDIPKNKQDAVLAVVLREAEKAYLENLQNRVIEFSDVVDGYKFTTTSADVARRIGRKIQAAFNTREIESTQQSGQYLQGKTKMTFVVSEYF